MKYLLTLVALLGLAAPVAAQNVIPPPATPVVFCGVQALPVATSYRLIFDGGAPAPLTMDATTNTGCPAGTSASFQVPAASFTVGSHTVVVVAVNTFGSTLGATYTVTVGIAPGAFSINAVLHP